MAGGTIIAPLTNSQKVFLQRLLVAHVLTGKSALVLFLSRIHVFYMKSRRCVLYLTFLVFI